MNKDSAELLGDINGVLTGRFACCAPAHLPARKEPYFAFQVTSAKAAPKVDIVLAITKVD
jgi:hypothetical protein